MPAGPPPDSPSLHQGDAPGARGAALLSVELASVSIGLWVRPGLRTGHPGCPPKSPEEASRVRFAWILTFSGPRDFTVNFSWISGLAALRSGRPELHENFTV